MKSPIQQVIEYILFEDFETLKEMQQSLLEDEKQMVVDAWIRGNKEGWDMQTDWPEDAARYYEEKFGEKTKEKL